MATGPAGRGDGFRCAVMKMQVFPLLGTHIFALLELKQNKIKYLFPFSNKSCPRLRGLPTEQAGQRRSAREPGGLSGSGRGPGGAGTSGTGLRLQLPGKSYLGGSGGMAERQAFPPDGVRFVEGPIRHPSESGFCTWG